LPLEEIKALYEAYDEEFKVLASENRFILVKKDLAPPILERLSLTHEFYLVQKVADIKDLDRVLLTLSLKKDETFCVRCSGFSENSSEERRAGEIIYENKNCKVNLEDPDVVVYLQKIDDRIAISFDKYKTDDFNKRDPNNRPFFHPLALSPKLARLFLNLARLRTDDRVLDPFCGSGSILIEADLMGLEAIGTDKDREMLWGCAQNMEFYKVKAKTDEGDATDIKLKDLDAIVTDPPYARASKVFDKDLIELYDEFLKSAFKSLKPEGFLVLAVPHDVTFAYASAGETPARRSTKGGAAKHGFKEVGNYLLYVHKSLTRRIFILRKPK